MMSCSLSQRDYRRLKISVCRAKVLSVNANEDEPGNMLIGISAQVPVHGSGHVEWKVRNVGSNEHVLIQLRRDQANSVNRLAN